MHCVVCWYVYHMFTKAVAHIQDEFRKLCHVQCSIVVMGVDLFDSMPSEWYLL